MRPASSSATPAPPAADMWCVTVAPDGRFQHATERRAGERRVAFSLAHWRQLDASAAGQFVAPPRAEDSRRLQVAFIAAAGLDLGARLTKSMNEARNRYGGTTCAAPSISATTPRRH